MKKIIFMILVYINTYAMDNQLSISYTSTNFDYREYDTNNKILDSEKKSNLGGLLIDYKYYFISNTILKTSVNPVYSLKSGKTEYVGAYIGSGQGYGSVISTTENKIQEIELNIFTKCNSCKIFVPNFTIGTGYRIWERKLSETQKEDYKWLFVKIGVGFDYFFTKDFSVGLSGNYKKTIDPVMETESFKFNLENVYEYNINIPMEYKFSENFSLIFANQYKYINIEDSNVISGYYEPRSKTRNFSSKIGLKISF